MRGSTVALVLVGCVAIEAAAQRSPAGEKPVSIESLRWLAGCWESVEADRVIQEQWMAPKGGLMLGMSRTVEKGVAVAYEATRIEERDGGLLFTAKPSRQSEASFRLSDFSQDEFVFTNPEHDFPRRIVYRRAADGSLAARIEGEVNGKRVGFDFPLKRVSCDAGGAR